MDRLILVNFLFVAAGTASPLDFLVWLPIVLRPSPLFAGVAHAALLLYVVILLGLDRDVNLVLPVALGIIPPLILK